MAELGKLKLVAFTGPQAATPQQLRRNKLIGRLREQIALAQAQAQGLTHYGTRVRTVRMMKQANAEPSRCPNVSNSGGTGAQMDASPSQCAMAVACWSWQKANQA